ncbi:Unknown protein [Striga hermonthica]|uniref:CCHC-type domain-containing protein n=1 Tax=Striga hermonthica TaxID=68872 RepID=A0A9N7N0P1_STRHE|nr:Unknown protein [Striga hermonthica]
MAEDLTDKLRKFKLSEKEEKGLEISNVDIEEGMKECQLSLLGKIYGEKKANYNGLKATLNNIWVTKNQFFIKNIGPNLFQFTFQSKEDKERILQGKSWTFDGQYILLKDWKPENQEFLEEDEKVKIWVQIHDLPLHWITKDLGLKKGGIIGRVVDVLVPSAESSNGHILKVQVELNLREPIPRGTKIRLGAENRWVSFRYENLQSFCFYCGLVGHIDKNCLAKKNDLARNVLNLGQFGEWLRGGPTYFSESKSYRSSASGDLSEKDSKKSPSQGTDDEGPQEREGGTPWIGNFPQSEQTRDRDVGGMVETPAKGKEIRITPDPLPSAENHTTLKLVESDTQLVEVDVQPVPSINRDISKRKKPIVRKLRVPVPNESASMEVDRDKTPGESDRVRLVLSKRPLEDFSNPLGHAKNMANNKKLKKGVSNHWEEWCRWRDLLHKAYLDEEFHWKQKSRIQWLQEGDKNTKLFHASVQQRRVTGSMDNIVNKWGRRCENEQELVGELECEIQVVQRAKADWWEYSVKEKPIAVLFNLGVPEECFSPRVGQWSFTVSALNSSQNHLLLNCKVEKDGVQTHTLSERHWFEGCEEGKWLYAIRWMMMIALHNGWTTCCFKLKNKALVKKLAEEKEFDLCCNSIAYDVYEFVASFSSCLFAFCM